MSDPAKVRRTSADQEESPFELIKRIANDETLWPAKGAPPGIQGIRKILADKNKSEDQKQELISAKAEKEIEKESNSHRGGLFGRRSNPNENTNTTQMAVKFYHAIIKAHALHDIEGLKEMKDSIVVNKHFRRQ